MSSVLTEVLRKQEVEPNTLVLLGFSSVVVEIFSSKLLVLAAEHEFVQNQTVPLSAADT